MFSDDVQQTELDLWNMQVGDALRTSERQLERVTGEDRWLTLRTYGDALYSVGRAREAKHVYEAHRADSSIPKHAAALTVTKLLHVLDRDLDMFDLDRAVRALKQQKHEVTVPQRALLTSVVVRHLVDDGWDLPDIEQSVRGQQFVPDTLTREMMWHARVHAASNARDHVATERVWHEIRDVADMNQKLRMFNAFELPKLDRNLLVQLYFDFVDLDPDIDGLDLHAAYTSTEIAEFVMMNTARHLQQTYPDGFEGDMPDIIAKIGADVPIAVDAADHVGQFVDTPFWTQVDPQVQQQLLVAAARLLSVAVAATGAAVKFDMEEPPECEKAVTLAQRFMQVGGPYRQNFEDINRRLQERT